MIARDIYKKTQIIMSFLKFLKGLFKPEKKSETPVTIEVRPEIKPEVLAPLVNDPAKTADLFLPVEQKQAEAPKAEDPKVEAKTAKEIKSKSKKSEPAPKDAAKPKQAAKKPAPKKSAPKKDGGN